MGTQNHKAVLKDDVHILWAWSDTGFPTVTDAADVGKVFRYETDDTLWVCTAYAGVGQADFTQITFAPSGGGGSADYTFPNDVTVTTDLTVGNDATVGGDLTVTGELHGGTKAVSIYAVQAGVDVTATDGKAYFSIPAILNGANLTRAQAITVTAGTTGTTEVDIYNVTDSVDMLTSPISIASTETVGTVGTIDTSNDDVATDDLIRIDVSAAQTTEAQGLVVTLEFKV